MEHKAERYTLYNGDCLEYMATMPDASVDAIITDPPYNAINRPTNGLRLIDKGSADSAIIEISTLSQEFCRISSGSIYVWCSDDQYSSWVKSFKQMGLSTRICAWRKSNPSPMNGQFLWVSALELCVFAKKKNAPFLLHCAHPLWEGPTERKVNHPTPKPVWLMAEQITASVPLNGIVLDPFMGSGTTGVAAMQTGRKFIGVELDADYFEIAKQRIHEATLPELQPALIESSGRA